MQTAVAPFVLEISCFPCLSFCPLPLLLLFFHVLSISPSPPFSLHQQSILPVPREYEGVRNRTSVHTKQELKEDEGQDEGVYAEQRMQV